MRKYFAGAFTFCILAVSLFSAVYFYNKYRSANMLLTSPKAMADEEARVIAQKVGKLVLLPEGRVPALATVTDADKLKDQQLFAHAKNGDLVLIYSAEKRAVLYRKSTGKVIDMGPIAGAGSLGMQPNDTSAGASNALKVALYNGSKITELSTLTRQLIRETYPDASFVDIRNTINSYQKNMVIDVTGANKAAVDKLAGLLEGEVSALPLGEEKPSADILVIVGK